jgi:hypothetical protein
MYLDIKILHAEALVKRPGDVFSGVPVAGVAGVRQPKG